MYKYTILDYFLLVTLLLILIAITSRLQCNIKLVQFMSITMMVILNVVKTNKN